MSRVSGSLLEQSAQMRFHTDMRAVFQALEGRALEFDWLITDLELRFLDPPDGLPVTPLLPTRIRPNEACGVTGRDLDEFVNRLEIQFTWAVFSGFPNGRLPRLVDLAPYPYAEGNRGLWKPGATVQHPDAVVEIVAWDSSATLLLSRDDDLTRCFRAHFTDAVDLNAHNTARRRG